jgi:hypothetical protein
MKLKEKYIAKWAATQEWSDPPGKPTWEVVGITDTHAQLFGPYPFNDYCDVKLDRFSEEWVLVVQDTPIKDLSA